MGAEPEKCYVKTAAAPTVSLEAPQASSYSSYSRVLESSTPSLRKSASRASPAERQFAFDTACQCAEEASSTRGPAASHAQYFSSGGFKILREALQTDLLEEEFQISHSASVDSHEEDTADSGAGALQLKATASSADAAICKKLGIWTKIKRRLSTESAGKAVMPESPQCAAIGKHTPTSFNGKHDAGPSEEKNSFSFVSINMEQALALLVAAAPSRGEVQHWVWLIRAYMDKCSIESLHIMLGYLVRVGRCIAPEEEWFRLLLLELTPVLEIMRDNDLPTESKAVLRAVADRAMQVSDDAILNFRAHRCSRLENALLLSSAVRLQVLVAKCASGADCTDMGGLFEELLMSAAQQRFRSLLSKATLDAGVASPTARAEDTLQRRMASLATVCDQVVQDVADDDECYQAAFPSECRIILPSISCRVYCNLLRTEVVSVLGKQAPETKERFFDLFQGVSQMEQVAVRWCPGLLGSSRTLCSSNGRPVFLPYIETWMRGVRAKLMQWGTRLLREEVWQHPAASSSAGLQCSPSLVELFRALCSVAEDNTFVSAAHPVYAGLMERTLSKAVMCHVAGLERLCQAEMPAKNSRRLPGHLRSIGSRCDPPRDPFRPSSTLCMLLNDMREIRSKQADLSNAVRARLPAAWWGQTAGDGSKEKMRLGDRFKLCQIPVKSLQVEIERRYAAVLHHTVKRMAEGMTPQIVLLLAAPGPDEDYLAVRAEPLISCMEAHLASIALLLDGRVLRRVARELWNNLAGVLHDDLVDCQEGEPGSAHHSLGNVGPRIQHIDAALKLITDFIVGHRFTGLTAEDEPEKVAKLKRMLALFLREDEGQSIDSL